MDKTDTAYLSSDGSFTIFTYNGTRLKFVAPYSLDRYIKVLKWDNGYIEVLTKYFHNEEDEEEYIDLIPVIKDLYMEPEEFLMPIKNVEVRYD